MRSAQSSYRDALRHRDFRLLTLAQAQSAMGDWAYSVALVVFVYARTGSAGWVSATMLARLVPRLIASPYAGVIAERFERIRLMLVLDLIRVATMLVLAVVCAVDGPLWPAILMACVTSTVGCAYAPATAAMTPQLLGEEELAAGNAMGELINNVAIIAGPGIGALVLAVGRPWVVMAANAGTFAVSAALLSRIRARSVPTDVRQQGGVIAQTAVGVKAVVGSATAALLTAFTIATTLLYGVDSVLFVNISRDKLGSGAEGYGYLLMALGVGGIVGAGFVNRLGALPRLSLVLSLGMVAFALPTLALVWVHQPAVAFAVEVVRGVATLVVDVLAMTALQRSLAPDMIARVFGVFWALITLGQALGTLAAPLLLAGLGLDGALWADALVVPVLVVLAYPRLAELDRIASSSTQLLAPRVTALQSLDLFSAASRTAVERLARGAQDVVVPADTSILRQGEPADALYVLADGRVEVTVAGDTGPVHIRFMDAPCYVGEIGLLQRIPRTATVTSVGACTVWRIDGDDFLSALTETSLSAAFVSGMDLRLKRTSTAREVSVPAPRTVHDSGLVEAASPRENS